MARLFDEVARRGAIGNFDYVLTTGRLNQEYAQFEKQHLTALLVSHAVDDSSIALGQPRGMTSVTFCTWDSRLYNTCCFLGQTSQCSVRV